MKRGNATRQALAWGLRILLVLGVLGVFFLKPVSSVNQSANQQPDTASITTYDSTMDLRANGDLRTEENLDVLMPPGKHGIFRIFDTADPRRTDVDHPVTVESVERDGRPEPYTEESSAKGTDTIRIGAQGTILNPGVHQYRIVSSTVDTIEPGAKKSETVWWWDVVGSGWQMSIDSANITANLPAEPLRAECVMAERTPCQASLEGKTLRVKAGPMAPFTPVTVRVTFPADELPLPPPSQLAGSGLATALIVGLSSLGAIVAAGVAFLLFRETREDAPGYPVLFEPPEGVYPALGVKVLDETHSPDELQATLFDLGERGVLRFDGAEDQWAMSVIADPATVELNQAELAVLGALGLNYTGASFTVSKSVSAGEMISKAKSALKSHVDVDSRQYLSTSPPGCLALALGWTALVASVLQIGVYFFGEGGFLFWPALATTSAFALVAMGMMFDRGVITKRTETGRDTWSRVGGFARFLTTDSSESRFEAAKHMDLYPRYLPWALALGSADAWAQRYQEQSVELPVVPWLIWYGAAGSFSMNSMSNSFNSAISSASSAYAASQVSSGGGGGFGGGSGGGGGGGGSW